MREDAHNLNHVTDVDVQQVSEHQLVHDHD